MPPRDTNGVFDRGNGIKGGQEELRRIALVFWYSKVWVVKQPGARGGSQRRVGVELDALDTESRGLSTERARSARFCTKRAELGVNVEEPTEGSQAQQHLRDCAHEASIAEVCDAHAKAAAAVPLRLPGHILLGHAVNCHA